MLSRLASADDCQGSFSGLNSDRRLPVVIPPPEIPPEAASLFLPNKDPRVNRVMNQLASFFSRKRFDEVPNASLERCLKEGGEFSRHYRGLDTQLSPRFESGQPGPLLLLSVKRLNALPDGTAVYDTYSGARLVKGVDFKNFNEMSPVSFDGVSPLKSMRVLSRFGLRPPSLAQAEVAHNRIYE